MTDLPETNSNILNSFINYVRLSTAVALIKTKPPGKDPKQHAIDLQRALSSRQQIWKEKYLQTKNELLELKQAAFLSSVKEKISSAESHDDPETEDGISRYSLGAACLPEIPSKSNQLMQATAFLKCISNLRHIDSGNIVIQNSAAVSVISDTFVTVYPLLSSSFLSEYPYEFSSIRIGLIRYMVEVLRTVASVRRCPEVQTSSEAFFDVVINHFLSSKHKDQQSSIKGCLYTLADVEEYHFYISKSLFNFLLLATQKLLVLRAQEMHSFIDQINNVPKVTELLLELDGKFNMAKYSYGLVSTKDLVELRENIDKHLDKFPLYSTHLFEVFHRLGFWRIISK